MRTPSHVNEVYSLYNLANEKLCQTYDVGWPNPNSSKILVGKCDTQNFILIFNFEIYIHCHYSSHVQNWIHKIRQIMYAT
jgi:hypothetical protein